MKNLKFISTSGSSLEDLLMQTVNEALASDLIKTQDIILHNKVTFPDESTDLTLVITIPNIYSMDSVEHIEKNSSNFDSVIRDFIDILIQATKDNGKLNLPEGPILLSEDFPILIKGIPYQGKEFETPLESLLINISDDSIHIYYNHSGQY